MPTTIDASFIDSLPANVAVQFLERVAKSPQREAFRYPEGDGWKSVTWKQAGDDVSKIAAGLLSLGVQAEQRVGIASGTRYEWILADLGIMCAGAATTTVYPSHQRGGHGVHPQRLGVPGRLRRGRHPDRQAHRAQVRAAEPAQGRHLRRHRPTATGSSASRTSSSSARPTSPSTPGVIEETAKGISGDQLATLIYTSGTTGRPKGVRLRHSSWVYEGEAIRAQNILSEDDLEFRWLPMAHSFGKVLMSTQMACGFSAAIDGRVDKIIDNLAVVKPTFMGAAPRIFEKAHGRIMTMQAAEGGAEGEDLQPGLQGRPPGRQAQARGQVRPAAAVRCSTRCSTSWSSPRSATASAAGCGSSSPAPRRSTATSPSGSTPPASSSSRATGSPSRRPARS